LRVVDISSDLPHKAFLPIDRRKLLIAGIIFAALSSLLIAIDPFQPIHYNGPTPTLLILATSILIILIAILGERRTIKGVSFNHHGRSLRVTLTFEKAVSGIVEVGELTATEYRGDDFPKTIYTLDPEDVSRFYATNEVTAEIRQGVARGLAKRSDDGVMGVLRCPGARITTLDGHELFLAWLRPGPRSPVLGVERSHLYSGGAECTLSSTSTGEVRFTVSASGVGGGLLPFKAYLKVSRVLSLGVMDILHEEVITEVRGGEAEWGLWTPQGYRGDEALVIFNGSRRLLDLIDSLKIREFVSDPAPGVEYYIVLESRGWLQIHKDRARMRLELTG